MPATFWLFMASVALIACAGGICIGHRFRRRRYRVNGRILRF